MTQKLTDFLQDVARKKYATQAGTDMHAKMQRVVIHAGDHSIGNPDIVKIIQNRPDLKPFFLATNFPQTEVPIAGYINGVFVSRRLDRLVFNHTTKTLDFVDYKTDTDKTIFVDKYKHQLNEYAMLLHSAYPGYKINGYILWLHDWSLEQVVGG